MLLSNVLYSQNSLLSCALSISLCPAGKFSLPSLPGLSDLRCTCNQTLFLLNHSHQIPPSFTFPFFTHFLFPPLTDILYYREDEIGDSCKAIVFLCYEEALWAFKTKNDCSNTTPPFLFFFFFCSAVQLDSCGAQNSGHPEHQDRAVHCHEQRGLPLHFGMVCTYSTVIPFTSNFTLQESLLKHYHAISVLFKEWHRHLIFILILVVQKNLYPKSPLTVGPCTSTR